MSNCSLPSPVSGLHIEILSNSIVPQLPVLVYHGEGNCEWDLRIINMDIKIVTGSDSQRLPLANGIIFDLRATCTVNGTVLLNAIISTRGKIEYDYGS